MSNKFKILVTGAAGFIGSHLAERLANAGHTVVGIDNFNSYYDPKLKQLNANDVTRTGTEILNLDLATDDLISALDRVEIIYHLAAQPGISATTSFAEYERNNLLATYRLLDAAKNSSKLKLFANIATSSVYGSDATGDETSEPKPTSYYGVTKLAAEQLVMAEQRDRNFSACSFRLFSVYGPRERPEKFFTKLIAALEHDTEITVYEGSEQHVRSFSYVGDIVDGLASALDKIDTVKGEIINLGSPNTFTTGDAIEILEKLTNRKARKKILPKRSGDQEKTSANIAKAQKILKFAPTTTLQEGLRAQLEWYRSNFEN